MKLVPKLNLAFIAGVSVLLSVNGYLRVQREVGLFESDRIRDDVVIARTLGAAVASVWKSDGPESALAVVSHAAQQQGRVRIRWVWLDDDSAGPTSASREALRALAPDVPLTLKGTSESNEDRRFTIVRVALPGSRPGGIEVSEPLETERAYIRRTILDTVATTL